MSFEIPDRYKIIYLADYPEYIETCAAWHFTAWGVKSDKRTLRKDIKKFENSIEKNSIPLTILCLDKKRNVPVAMGAIWEKDSDYWTEITPWITGIYVHEDYRKQGLAKSILCKLEQDAKRIGISNIYLTASAAVGLYEKMKYEIQETRDAPETPTGKQTLFVKDLGK